MTKNQNKNVLITGASRGIGKSIAQTLTMEGYNVYICARNENNLKATLQEIKATKYYTTDLTNTEQCKMLISNIIDDAGSIDILINNAGDYVYSAIEQTKEEDIDRLISLNIKAPYLLTKLSVENMKKNNWGRIINIGSISGIVGEANASLYSMTKSAYTGFSKSLALELATNNITINTINPGWVETELAENAISESDFSYEEEIAMIPQKRFIQPYEIAELVKYLVSENAKGMTGQNISLCAGLSAG